MSLVDRDRRIMWHPFSQEESSDLPIAIERAKGSYIYDKNGKSYLDLISSWWVNIHGHGHQKISQAIYDQAKKIDHIMFAGFTHDPAVSLCENLLKILPKDLTRCFYSDNGSTAVEIALKMSYQYWFNKGEKQRTLFISFDGGYHGDTFGAMSVGKESDFYNPFQKFMFEVLFIPLAHTWYGDENIDEKESKSLEYLNDQLKEKSHLISAMIIEPLVQGASGMRIYRTEFIKKVINLIKKFDILIIFDEVMTGFGRTGANFALNQINICPDFLCISKGITGGVLPLALTITKKKIYDAFLSDNWDKAFAHGHSYTANPIACAAGLASLELFLQKETQDKINIISAIHQKFIKELFNSNREIIKHTRTIGTIAAFDLKSEKNLTNVLKRKFLENGLLLRPLKNTVYLLPPYSIKEEELKESYSLINEIINEV